MPNFPVRRIALCLVALTVLPSACALAQKPVDVARNRCLDDSGTNRCAPDVQRSVREAYGLESIEALAAAGVEVRRALFVDGYGNDMPAVSFERRPGMDPRVVVSVRVEDGDARARVVVMESPVPLGSWNDLLQETRHFDRELLPLAPAVRADGTEVICLHGWTVTVEADAGDAGRGARTRTESACADGLAVDAAFAMARRANGLLPHCGVLKMEHYRNELVLFETCALLEGDRMAAAEAVNQFTQLQRRYQAPTTTDLVLLVEDDVTLEWPGDAIVRGWKGAAQFWGRYMLDAELKISRVRGEHSRRVRVTGTIVTRPDDDRHTRAASFEQIWSRDGSFEFRLRELRVGAFEPPHP